MQTKTPTVESFHCVVAKETEDAPGRMFHAEANKGILATDIFKFLDALSDEDLLAPGLAKAYIAIFTGEPSWTKGLSEEMDGCIEAALQ